MEARKIKEECMFRWGDIDDKISKFDAEFDDWFNSLPEEFKSICLKLLNKFEYYSQDRAITYLNRLHTELISNYEINFSTNSILSIVESLDCKANSSLEYVIQYKLKNKITQNAFFTNISGLSPQKWSLVKNLVVVDDCVGTGNTFIKFLRKYKKRLRKSYVHLITLHCMVKGKEAIINAAKELKINVIIHSMNFTEKAFSDYIFNKADIEKNKVAFVKHSKKLRIEKSHILGYKESESLMAFYSNTPNNTLGLFRYKSKRNEPLFPRNDEPSTTISRFKENKRNRGCFNYMIKSLRNKINNAK